MALVGALFVPAAARADGDPASDTLYKHRVFLPPSRGVRPALAAQLEQATADAERARMPVRVALIAAPVDLGAVPSLFGQPRAYARFLGMELQFVYPGRLLVVMPQGAALAVRGRLVANAAVARAHVRTGGDGLATTALRLVRVVSGTRSRAAPAARPPVVQGRAQHAGRAVRGPATDRVPVWEGAAIAVAAVCTILLAGLVVVRRRMRVNRLHARGAAPVRPPNPDDPYRYTGPL